MQTFELQTQQTINKQDTNGGMFGMKLHFIIVQAYGTLQTTFPRVSILYSHAIAGFNGAYIAGAARTFHFIITFVCQTEPRCVFTFSMRVKCVAANEPEVQYGIHNVFIGLVVELVDGKECCRTLIGRTA